MKAIVAVEHGMPIAAFHMLSNAEFYRDPGADYYTRRDPARTKARALKQLQALRYDVTLQPTSPRRLTPRDIRTTARLAVANNHVTNHAGHLLWSPTFTSGRRNLG